MEIILNITSVVLLFLVYRKLSDLTESFEVKNENEEYLNNVRDQKNINFHNWLHEKLRTIYEKIKEISDVTTVENPAWGKDSAESKKKGNLVKLYAQRLVEKEEFSQKDALIKSKFIIDNFPNGIIDEIIHDANFKERVRSEKELLKNDFFKKEVEVKTNTLKAKDFFEPLWIGIKIRKYKKGDELLQNTSKAFGAHSGQYGYQNYVEDSAIVSKLANLGIFEVKMEKNEARKTMSGHPFYILKEDNLEKLRKMIFLGDEQNNEYYTDEYFTSKYAKDERIKLPFQRPFEIDD